MCNVRRIENNNNGNKGKQGIEFHDISIRDGLKDLRPSDFSMSSSLPSIKLTGLFVIRLQDEQLKPTAAALTLFHFIILNYITQTITYSQANWPLYDWLIDYFTPFLS